MTNKWILGVALAAALTIPVVARAHPGHAHKVMGTVTARNGNDVEVKTPDGKSLTVVLTDKTTFSRNKQKVDGADVKAGVRVVVDVVGEKDMTAKAVTLSALTAVAARK